MSGEPEPQPELEGPPTPRPPEAAALSAAEIWRRTPAFLSLFDFGAKPTSKAGWLVRGVAIATLAVLLYKRVQVATFPLLSAHPPSPIPVEEIEDYRFKLPERTRRAIFEELAAAELAERARAIASNTWGGHQWSREDDRGYYERALAQRLATKYRCSLTQIYLVLDEGIREHWEGPDGNPLPATTPPLNIRSNSW